MRFAGTDPSTVPAPAAGKATLFVDVNDLSFKAKLPDNSIIPISVTEEYLQDIIGNTIQDSSTVDFIYDDVGNIAYFEVIEGGLDISQIPVIPQGNLTSTNLQDALYELQENVDLNSQNLTDHLNDAVDAHNAAAISYNNATSGLTSIEAQSAIDEVDANLDQEIIDRTDADANLQSQIDAHLDGGNSKHDATEIDYERVDGDKSSIQASSDNVETAISDLDDNKLDKNGDSMTGPLELYDDPMSQLEAATKRYVDNAIQGLNAKTSVAVATTGPGNLSTDFENGDTIDGFVLTTGDRILIKNQVNQAQNGIYDVQASGVPLRSSDSDTFDKLVSAFVFVENGVILQNTGWTCTAVAGGTIDVDPLPWVQFSSAGVVTTDGQGIERVGNELQLELDGITLSKTAAGLRVANQGITDSQVNNAADINVSKLGTGIIDNDEFNRLEGVTSNIQTQLDDKTPLSHLDGGNSKHDAFEIDYENPDIDKTDISNGSDTVEFAITDLDDNKLSRNGNNTMAAHLDVGGFNVENVGTVDGRDVSVDGSKLDTIESNAKDDQLASEVPVTPAGNIASTNVQSALEELDAEKQPLDGDLTAISNLTGTGLIARNATNSAVVRTIQAAGGETTVANGDGVSGNPTIGLPDVGAASTVGAANSSLSITTDAKGRITAKASQLIAIVSSQVTDFASAVRNTLLTGYSVGANVALAATDTVLQAFQKIQGQINERIQGPASATDNAITRYDGATGKLAQNSAASVDDNGGIVAGDFVRPSNTADTTNGNLRYNNNEAQGRVNGVWRNLAIVPTTTSQTGDASTTSATYGVITGMTTTPAAGIYMVIFECSAQIGPDTNGDIAFFVGATEQTDSTKTLSANANGGFGPTATIEIPVTMIGFFTVNGAQAISAQYRENGGGTLTVGPRKLTIIPIAR